MNNSFLGPEAVSLLKFVYNLNNRTKLSLTKSVIYSKRVLCSTDAFDLGLNEAVQEDKWKCQEDFENEIKEFC